MKTTKILIAICLLISVLTGCQTTAKKTDDVSKALNLEGTITTIEKNDVTIHSYVSPESGYMVTTHIIETVDNLVVIDAQFLRAHAQEVLTYIEHLNKPVDRIIITHAHPDHWFGLEYFPGIPVYALEEVQTQIEQSGDFFISYNKGVYGELVTETKIVPQHIINEKTTIINGVQYEFEKVADAEAGIQLLIKLPQLQTLICQDLVFNNAHFFLGQNALPQWLTVNNYLKGLKGYQTVLAGHGEPTDTTIFKTMETYLVDASKILKTVDNGKDLKQALVEKYPDYRAPILLDISGALLFQTSN